MSAKPAGRARANHRPAVIGILALGLALGAYTQPTDQRGSPYLLRGNSFQDVLLSVVVIGPSRGPSLTSS